MPNPNADPNSDPNPDPNSDPNPDQEDSKDEREGDDESQQRWCHDGARAAIGGVVTLVIGSGAAMLLGSSTYFEVQGLVAALTSVLPYLASAGIAASATVLALMLNLLGLSRRSDADLSKVFYRRVQWIGRQASTLFVGSMLLLLTLAFPAVEADAFDGANEFVVAQFYLTSALTALLSGLAVSMVLMLQSTLSDLVMVLGLRVETHYLIAPISP